MSESNEVNGHHGVNGFEEKEKIPESEHGSPSHSEGEGDYLAGMGYKQETTRNRSMLTLLFQSLAIAAIPYGEGSALAYSIYGGGQLSFFVGWIMVCILDEFVALSLAELASRFPTSGGPSYWSFRLAPKSMRVVFAYMTGWVWVIGNWTITLSVNFGFASVVSGTVAMYLGDSYTMPSWTLLLIFYAITLSTLFICTFCNRFLPNIDTICAGFTALTILIIFIALSASADAGRNSAAVALGQYDKTLSGWGGFSFFIGLLPAAYTFSAVGMISSMAEECPNPTIKVPRAISWCIPVGFVAGLFFILPICFTMPGLMDIYNSPEFTLGQALPYIFKRAMGSPGGGLGLIFLVLVITIFCSISITVAASRATWAFARDNAIPGAKWWGKMNERLGVPVWALVLITVIQMLLGLIRLGSTTAFTAFISVGVQALALSYAIPISLSFFSGRKEVNKADWTLRGMVGTTANILALLWITFELILFSMPTALPTTPSTMNYAVVLLVGFIFFAAVWYLVYARKTYKGPPDSDGL